METKGALLLTGGVAAATGAVALYANTKALAFRALQDQGAFADAEKRAGERTQEAKGISDNIDKRQERNIASDLREAKKAVVKEHHADKFSGAWNQLSLSEKRKGFVLAAVSSVAAGAMTYLVAKGNGRGTDAADALLWLGIFDIGSGLGH